MSLATLLIPPSLDAKQALRLRRFGLAALSYALSMGLATFAWTFGVLPAAATLVVLEAVVAINVVMYLLIRSGFNLRFGDPSLTRLQIMAAITVLMYIVYHLDNGRNVALFGCFFVFLFGVFRLSAREFTLVTLYTLAAYALVINLLMHWRPQAIYSVPLEWMSWLMLAGLLQGFTLIGGQISTLRRRLRESEARFRSLTEMSSDFYWESDAEHRISHNNSSHRKLSTEMGLRQGVEIGERPWEIPYLSPDEAGWQAHRAVLDAHRPFRNFELSRLGTDGTERHLSISGDPVFDGSGAFKGYRGVGTSITSSKRREEKLRQFRVAMDASADAIYLVERASMRFVDVNEAACRMQNLTREELLALGPDELLSIPRKELERTYDSVIAGGAGAEPVEMLRQRKDGTQVWVELRRRARRTGESWTIVTTVRDITERKNAESALRDSAERLQLFADNVPAMTASLDENLRLVFINKRYADFFGYARADILGRHVREIVGERVYSEIESHFVQVLQGHPVTYHRTRKLPNGELCYLEVRLLPHIGERGQTLGCFAVTSDITEHKLAEESIQRVAYHDSLTGLPNRLLFDDRLNHAISLAKRGSSQFALLYLDLDRFKPVNDALGHAAGDELLQAVAARIRRQVRESDTVARVGGDEFTVILPDIGRRENAETVARKIIAALAAPFQLGSQKHSVEIGTSVGIAIYPADALDAEALVKAADAAMYSAKQSGSSLHFCAA